MASANSSSASLASNSVERTGPAAISFAAKRKELSIQAAEAADDLCHLAATTVPDMRQAATFARLNQVVGIHRHETRIAAKSMCIVAGQQDHLARPGRDGLLAFELDEQPAGTDVMESDDACR
jgi:hypothetical protein